MQQSRQGAEVKRRIAALAEIEINWIFGQVRPEGIHFGQAIVPIVADLFQKRRHQRGDIDRKAADLGREPERDPVITLKRRARMGLWGDGQDRFFRAQAVGPFCRLNYLPALAPQVGQCAKGEVLRFAGLGYFE